MAEQKENKPINITKTVEYLNRTFQEACKGLAVAQKTANFNTKTNEYVSWKTVSEREKESQQHYDWQVEMAYLIDEIQRGPTYIVAKLIADANKLIETVQQYKKQASA